jgi:hypothetical protein
MQQTDETSTRVHNPSVLGLHFDDRLCLRLERQLLRDRLLVLLQESYTTQTQYKVVSRPRVGARSGRSRRGGQRLPLRGANSDTSSAVTKAVAIPVLPGRPERVRRLAYKAIASAALPDGTS